jgi:Ran GTPase-activating protein (RanGAP) involved in mRNA processing and transport
MTTTEIVNYIKGYRGYNPTPCTPATVINGNSLDIRNRKQTVTEDKLNQIGKILEGIPLKSIDISGNDLTDNIKDIILDFFTKYFPNAISFDLSRNKFGSDVAKLLEEVIPYCKNLEYLCLIENNFSPEEIECLKKVEEACNLIRLQEHRKTLEIIFEM